MMCRWCGMVLLLWSLIGSAAIEAYHFGDPAQEADYKRLIAELRCLVCQNQNLADSNAELAQDMRRQVYEMLQGGSSHEQVVDYMVQRYGDFVMYRPPFNAMTTLLWVGPFVILILGVVLLLRLVRHNREGASNDITKADLAQVKELLGDKGEDR